MISGESRSELIFRLKAYVAHTKYLPFSFLHF